MGSLEDGPGVVGWMAGRREGRVGGRGDWLCPWLLCPEAGVWSRCSCCHYPAEALTLDVLGGE